MRTATRNGYKPRELKTRFEDISLLKPEFREKPFTTVIFDRYSRVEKALINAICESYIQGVSTRKVRHIIEALGIKGISADTVSRIAKGLDEKVDEFLNRPIEQPIVYLIVDEVYVKVRHQCRYVNQAVLLIAGIREDGLREILGVTIANSEEEGTWISLFEDLKNVDCEGCRWSPLTAIKAFRKRSKFLFLVRAGRCVESITSEQFFAMFPGNLKSRLVIS